MRQEFNQHGGVAIIRAKDFTPTEVSRPVPRVGVVSNPRSHRNNGGSRPTELPEAVVFKREPSSRNELVSIITQFANEGVELIVIDGGDGTVRDVLSVAHMVYRGALPRVAVIPSGKTNALAFDLALPAHWSLGDAIRAHMENRVADRAPVHIHWNNNALPDQLGFIFGLGVFSRATLLAQRVHRKGMFNAIAVAMTVLMALLKSLFGGPRNSWRRGDMARVSRDGVEIFAERVYLMLASTLRQMPVGLRPFGRIRDGLKFLTVKAPPRALHRNFLAVIKGRESPALEADGYIRRDADKVYLSLDRGFILDGEQFPGGNLIISRGRPIQFVVPA
ncbi:hypothetical protein ABIC78_001463 [Novosphingobium sp. 1529]|uniref:diacylglycerol/lipid kinase family protein n=1 Tax=unclassified Novosphingobium TaxID=2644732 RepID=UPI0003B461CA|nr:MULTISPECIES: diacylglycerol kinase family protein [unclassified Novosphingobium]